MTPITLGYRPELDVKDKLYPRRADYYQGLIGGSTMDYDCLKMGTLGTSVLRIMVASRWGHLEQAF